MKAKLIWVFFIATTIVFSGCDPSDVNTDFKNYWTSNSLVRLKLRGKVKSLQVENQRYDFNEQGFTTSSSYATENYSTTVVYNYGANGQLVSSITTSVNQDNTSTEERAYNYDDHGRYVVNSTFHIHEVGLTPNLKAIVGDGWRTDFIFNGDNLLVINANAESKDTVIVKYDGKYPVSGSTSWSFIKDMEFASNGMFTKYSEGFTGQGYSSTRIYTFEKDDAYQLLKSVRYENMNGEDLTVSTRTLTYNENKDLLTDNEDDYQQEYFDYVYDDKNNWISRKYRFKSGSESDWYKESTETRIITYWD